MADIVAHAYSHNTASGAAAGQHKSLGSAWEQQTLKRKQTKNMISSDHLPISSEVTFKKLKDKFYNCPQAWIRYIISVILLKVPNLFI